MTITKHEILTVTTAGDDPQSIINAMHALPADATFVEVEGVESIRDWGRPVPIITQITFTFRREVTDE